MATGMQNAGTAGELIGIGYSPWTEKARWSLDYHQLRYTYSEHTLLLGVPHIRWRMRRLFSDFTVPAWIDEETRIDDSLRIAYRADQLAARQNLKTAPQPLIPAQEAAQIEKLHALCDQALDALRALALVRIAQDPSAQLEALPVFIPPFLRGFLRKTLVGSATAYVWWTFYRSKRSQTPAQILDQYLNQLRSALSAIRTIWMARPEGSLFMNGKHLTFGDICVAASVSAVEPPRAPFFRLGPASRGIWRNPELATEFADLLAWRDLVYEKHRPKRNK